MGCDYYHEAALDVEEDSNISGELEITISVYDENENKVNKRKVSVEVPVGGEVFIDRYKSPEVWAR